MIQKNHSPTFLFPLNVKTKTRRKPRGGRFGEQTPKQDLAEHHRDMSALVVGEPVFDVCGQREVVRDRGQNQGVVNLSREIAARCVERAGTSSDPGLMV